MPFVFYPLNIRDIAGFNSNTLVPDTRARDFLVQTLAHLPSGVHGYLVLFSDEKIVPESNV